MNRLNAILVMVVLVVGLGGRLAVADEIELTHAVVTVPEGLDGPESRAVRLLIDEIKRRSRADWSAPARAAAPGRPVIVVTPARLIGKVSVPAEYAVGLAPEGYRIETGAQGGATRIAVVGTDARGVLFGVGRLLRSVHIAADRVTLPRPLSMATSPKYAIRGQQLGYRPKTNSYDAWDLPRWERYIGELAQFGVNTIELLPPRTDDLPDSPHFPLPPMEMMVGMSRICAEFGLDVSIWYPAMEADYTNPATVAREIDNWGRVFQALPRVDDVFVPGGDPGHTRPRTLLALLEKQAENLRRYHPHARMWVSAQGFSQEWLDEFLAILKEEPPWLSGVAYGPQTRIPLPELRAKVPARYPIRDYPDITHSLRCQYPVPDWDVAYSVTAGREPINPRPRDEAAIFHAFADQTVGFVTYSEGCNDDVNKIVWSALGWSPDASLVETLREYARTLVGLDPAMADGFAQGLFALEENWRGPLIANSAVETTLARFQTLEQGASPSTLHNWRFQQALFRAYYDAYVRRRLIAETDLEQRAVDMLRQARSIGPARAIDEAQTILESAVTHRPGLDLRARAFELAEALFQSIGMQLSVAKYKAIAIGRGTMLDTIDAELNNADWFLARFAAIRGMSSTVDQARAVHAMINWTNPGPGGFYDDLGDPLHRPHVVLGSSYEQDPAGFRAARTGFDQDPRWRRSWCRHATGFYDGPLTMHYDGLDPEAAYRVRVVYTGDMWQVKLRLLAGHGLEVHPFLLKPRDMSPLEFDIPREATRKGSLDLSWHVEPGRGGNGRGCQVSEVWLIRGSSR